MFEARVAQTKHVCASVGVSHITRRERRLYRASATNCICVRRIFVDCRDAQCARRLYSTHAYM